MTIPPQITPAFVHALERTLEENGVDVERTIDSFGQVEASRKRLRGEPFELRDHVRGLLLALLSNQRPWGPIAERLPELREIFLDYDPQRLEQADPDDLLAKILAVRCGNRAIKKQLGSLRGNIARLREIAARHGSLDAFVTSGSAEQIATRLSKPNGPEKIQQLGLTLAMEYLRNVGIRATKPDLHIVRICGAERLGWFPPKCSPEAAARIFHEMVAHAKEDPVRLDNLLWLLGAKDYAAVCGATPRCDVCELTSFCKWPQRPT